MSALKYGEKSSIDLALHIVEKNIDEMIENKKILCVQHDIITGEISRNIAGIEIIVNNIQVL